MARIYVHKGPMKGRSFGLKNGTTLIGRGGNNDIQLNDPSVSRKHLRIVKRQGIFVVEDLRSQNGTWVEGKALKPGKELEVESGNSIAVGNVLIRLDNAVSELGMTTRYSINLSAGPNKSKIYPLYRDSRITDRRKLEIIYEVSLILMQTHDINEICEKIMDSLFSNLKRIDSGVILLIDGSKGDFKEIHSKARNRNSGFKVGYSRSIVDRVINEGKAIIMSDTRKEEKEALSDSLEKMRVKSIMCVPLISKGSTMGVIYAHSVNVPNGFVKDDLCLFTGLSTSAALAIENAFNISGRERAEKALQDREEQYRLLVENTVEAICIIQDGKLKFANPGTLNLTGYTEEELSNKLFKDLFHTEDKEIINERHRKKLRGESVPGMYSFRIITSENKVKWVENNSVNFIWEGRPATLNFIRDITHQKNLEEQVMQSEKMEAIGTLSGGISHDFNNLLMGIQGNASLMMLDLDEDHPHYDKLMKIENYIETGAELTGQLAGFARGGKYIVKATDMNVLLTKCCEMFAGQGQGIKIFRRMQKGIWRTEVDQKQIQQAVLKLFSNASHSMPDGGELYLETENIPLKKSESLPAGLVPGRYVKLSIRDTGTGMDEATRKRIFDPFFTTREMKRGRGLGLAAVYGIIKNHDGTVKVLSENGKGTSFEIFLPTSEEKDDIPEISGLNLYVPIKGKETILIVDDEEMVANATRELLSTLGYKVLTAEGGVRAIEIYKEKYQSIDMVILDMIMPDMHGGEVFDELKKINPGVKVLLASGYSIKGEAGEIMKKGCMGFLKKPFSYKTLSMKIREIFSKDSN